MCVHVLCAASMPNNVLVWVDRQPSHNLVYVDASLFSRKGTLTARGVRRINKALADFDCAWTLDSSQLCNRPPLYGVAG